MRILIAHSYLNGYGGGERFVLEEADYLSKEHDVKILTWEYCAERTFKGFKKHSVEELKSGSSSLRKMMGWALQKRDVDVCNAHGFPSNFMALRNPGTVWYCHRPDLPFQDSWNPYYAGIRLFDRAAVERAKSVVTNSRFSAGLLRRYYNVEAQVVNPGINPDEFKQGKFGDYVLLVSRISPEKNIELALEAIKRTDGLKLKIVAGWADSRYMERLDLESGRAEVLNGVDDKSLKRLYSGCLCVLQTATNESFGMVPLEAMASGKPVVAPNRAGFRETITPGTGFLTEPEPEAVADAIMRLDKDRAEAKRMGRNGLKRAEEFRWSKKLKELEEILLKI